MEGDEDEAKRANNHDGLQESDSDPENQSESIVEETPVHKKRHHRLSREARQEEKRSKLLQRHPLHVKIIITLKSEFLKNEDKKFLILSETKYLKNIFKLKNQIKLRNRSISIIEFMI